MISKGGGDIFTENIHPWEKCLVCSVWSQVLFT